MALGRSLGYNFIIIQKCLNLELMRSFYSMWERNICISSLVYRLLFSLSTIHWIRHYIFILEMGRLSELK